MKNHTKKNDEDTWLTDSGASAHMCFRKKWFQSLKSLRCNIVVRVADDKMNIPAAIGQIPVNAFVTGKWKPKIITDVPFIPD